MTNWLVHLFVKNSTQTEDIQVRTSYGILASFVGIFCNLLLFGGKFVIGVILNSISVTADAFNNLSDAGSSIISFIGVKMASKPPDKDHPFGHGRIEYIAALIVAFLIIQVGLTFFKNAIEKIQNPEEISFRLISVLILLISIGVKLWMGAFNKKLGKRINSKMMMAVAADSLGDVITTSATILSVLFFKLSGINIDGFVGLIVALIVIWAGIGIARDTLEPLIGEAVDPILYKKISEIVESYEGIVGSHDLIVHNYGPNRSMASIHAEVPRDADIENIHEVIDKIERDVARELNIFLVIHMDPIETRNDRILLLKKQVLDTIINIDSKLSIHDFRMVAGKDQCNLIFDLVVPYEYKKEQQEMLQGMVEDEISKIDQKYQCVITVEKSFVSDIC